MSSAKPRPTPKEFSACKRGCLTLLEEEPQREAATHSGALTPKCRAQSSQGDFLADDRTVVTTQEHSLSAPALTPLIPSRPLRKTPQPGSVCGSVVEGEPSRGGPWVWAPVHKE